MSPRSRVNGSAAAADGRRGIFAQRNGGDHIRVYLIQRAPADWITDAGLAPEDTGGIRALLLERYRDHRVEVVCRRAEWEVGKARDEAHLLEGLLIALKHIDRVVKIIRGARSRESAGEKEES